MSRLFLNRDLIFKKKEGFSCAYNQRTGWFIPGDIGLWRFLKSFRRGRDIKSSDGKGNPRFDQLIQELLENKFLLTEPGLGNKYRDFFPMQTFYSVYYQTDSHTDIAVHRDGPHGEIDFEILTLEGTAKKFWDRCSGRDSIRQIAKDISTEQGKEIDNIEAQIFDILREWTNLSFQIVRLIPKPVTAYNSIPPHLISPAPFISKLKKPIPKRIKDTHGYHITGIEEGYRQFERIESTLSHIYRIPHPALKGKTYGEAFLSRLMELRPLKKGFRILEIGGGHGDISTSILKILKNTKPDLYNTITYFIYDLAPELIKTQRRLHKDSGVLAHHIHGNAEQLAIFKDSFDIIFSNEVIADFSTPEVSQNDVEQAFEEFELPAGKEFISALKDTPARFRLNFGAFRLLKEIERALKPGGLAIITEYGDENELPTRAKHLDHDEFTIHFGHMALIAKELGFKTRITDAYKFLKFQSNLELITHASYQSAFRLMENNGIHLPHVVYTKKLFKDELGEKADNLRNIRFIKVTDEPMDRAPIEIVKVLICEKSE